MKSTGEPTRWPGWSEGKPAPDREHVQIDSPSALCGLLGCNRQTPHHHEAVL
jgi:hypothetical protein